MLRISADVRDHMFAHALGGLPIEACGMFSVAEGSDLVDAFHPMRNAATSALVFMLDGREMLAVEELVEASGRTLHGIMHSHTHTSAYPSPTDVADIGRFDPFGTFHHVIVSLREAEPVLRSFLLRDAEITEEPVVIAGTEPLLQDGAGAMAAVSRVPKPTRRS